MNGCFKSNQEQNSYSPERSQRISKWYNYRNDSLKRAEEKESGGDDATN